LILCCALRRVLARNGSFSPHQAEDMNNTEISIVNRALEVEDLDVGQHLIGEGFDQSVLDDPTIRSPGWIRETAGEENQIFLPERLAILAKQLRPYDLPSGTQPCTIDDGVIFLQIRRRTSLNSNTSHHKSSASHCAYCWVDPYSERYTTTVLPTERSHLPHRKSLQITPSRTDVVTA